MTFDDFYEFVRSLWVVWLMLIFLGIVAWAYWPKRKKKLEEHGKIPFHENGEDR